MSFLPVHRTLKENLPLAALINVNDRVFEDVAPQGTSAPYIVWQTISGQANNHLDAPASFDDVQFQIIVYATHVKRAYEIREAIRTALEPQVWIMNPQINNYETDTKLYARGFDANWIVAR